MTQEDVLTEILELNRENEKRQERINVLVKLNREATKRDSTFEDGYTESIESYFTNL